jgi:hypothetical protein
MERKMVMVCATLVALAAPAFAGTERQLEQGDRVRVETADSRREYTLSAIQPDTLYVTPRGGGVVSPIAMKEVEKLELRVPRSKGVGALWGALIGGGVGGAAGMLYAIATWDEADADCGPSPVDEFCDTSISAWRVMGYTFAFGMPAMLLGIVIGTSAPGEKWERIDPPGDVGIQPGRDGSVVVQYTLSF